jgi:hypothetical protein
MNDHSLSIPARSFGGPFATREDAEKQCRTENKVKVFQKDKPTLMVEECNGRFYLLPAEEK